MTGRKIIAMYEMFGKLDGHRCVECCHLKDREETNVYWKCRLYGVSSSQATDWAKGWIACGMFNVLNTPHKDIYKSLPKSGFKEPELKGQMELEL